MNQHYYPGAKSRQILRELQTDILHEHGSKNVKQNLGNQIQ